MSAAVIALSDPGLERLRRRMLARACRPRRSSPVAAAVAVDVVALDDVGDVAAREPETETTAEAAARLRPLLERLFVDRLGTSRWGAAEAARRILAVGTLCEAGVTSIGEQATVLSTSVDTLERDQRLLARLGGPNALRDAA